MKHYLLATGLFIIAAVMTSCQKEQSELTLSSLPSTAVITGTVEYVAGDYEQTDGSIISNYQLPLAGQTVMVTIPTSNYAQNADGKQYFEAVTDESGNYRIEIPVSSQTLDNVSVDVLPFYAVKTLMHGGAIVEIENALYNKTTASSNNISLEQKKIYSVDLVVSSDDVIPVAFDKEINVKGSVQVQAWKADSDLDETSASYYDGGYNSYQADVTITATISVRNSGGQSDVTKITMYARSNSDGEFTETMLLPSNCLESNVTTTISAAIEDHLGDKFRHRYYISAPSKEWRSMEVDVIYNGATKSASLENDLIPLDLGKLTVTTQPIEGIDKIWGIGLTGPQDGETVATKNPFNWKNN